MITRHIWNVSLKSQLRYEFRALSTIGCPEQIRQALRQTNLKPQATPALFSEAGFPLYAALAASAATAQYLENQTPALSAPLGALLISVLLAATGVIPHQSVVYDQVWSFVMPTAAALFLLDIPRLDGLLSNARSTMIAFIIGAISTCIGTILSYYIFKAHLGPDGSKVAACLCASYIGGSLNFAAVAQALQLSASPVLAAAMAADNLAMAGYITIIMSIPNDDETVRKGHIVGEVADQPVTVGSIANSLAAATMACAAAQVLAHTFAADTWTLAIVAVIATVTGALTSLLVKQQKRAAQNPFRGSQALGGALMLLFFATIGASAGELSALQSAPWLLAFITVQLLLHILIILLVGRRVLKLPMAPILIASNANVGGPATAAAMASAKSWPHLVQPALMTGSLGYAVATAIGLGMYKAFL